MTEKFSFDAAFMHFLKTKGPKGFMWKFILTYSVVITIVIGAFYTPMIMGFATMFSELIQSGGNTEPDLEQMIPLLITMLVALPIFLVVYLIVYSMFEAAALRRYLYEDGFRLKLGADEFRIMGVLLLWAALFFAMYIIVAIVMVAVMMPVFMSGGDPESLTPYMGLVNVLQLVIYAPLLFFGVRLSPASAITMRDKKITFLSAWSVTRGKFWPILGAFLVVYLIVYAIQIVGMIIGLVPMIGGIMSVAMAAGPTDDPAAILAIFTNPLVIFGLIAMVFVYMISAAFAHFAFLGITSKVARTDPNWTNPSTVDTFD